MQDGQGMEFVQLTGGRPAQFHPYVLYVVVFSSAGHNAQLIIEDFLLLMF